MLTKRFFLLSFLFLLTCCSSLDQKKSATPTTITPYPNDVSPSLVSVFTPIVITETNSPVITMGVKTPDRINITKPPTYLPTDKYIVSLFQMSQCSFPCWWGITPGITSWSDAEKRLSALGFAPSSETQRAYKRHEIIIREYESIYKLTVRLYEKKDAVEYISVRSFLEEKDFRIIYKNYSPRDVLKKYGVPSRVKIYVSLLGDTNYVLDFFYDEFGFWISYNGKVAKNREKAGVLVCPDFEKNGVDGVSFFMQSKTIAKKIENFPEIDFNPNIRSSDDYFHSIQDATDLTPQQFADLFIEPEGSMCFIVKQ